MSFVICFYLILVLFIFFTPIPIKFTLKYSNNTLQVYFYSIPIHINKNYDNTNKQQQKKKPSKFKLVNIIHLIDKLTKNKLKPNLKLKIKILYGFMEPSNTGIGYGLLQVICPFIEMLLSKFFNIKKYSLDINPNFDNSIIDLQINSIISVSLVKIIYIIIIIFRYL